jgi:hypothetical protein
MLNGMFNLSIPDAVMERMIDLADYDRDGQIRWSEFARLFTSHDVLNMKESVSAAEAAPVRVRKPMGIRPSKFTSYDTHFAPNSLVPLPPTWELPAHLQDAYIPRRLLSRRGERLEPPPRIKYNFQPPIRHTGGAPTPDPPSWRDPRDPEWDPSSCHARKPVAWPCDGA